MIEKLKEIMQKKAELNLLKEEISDLENEVFERVKDNLIGCKKNYTLRFKEGFKLTVKLNPKLKVIGEVPEGVDVYKQTVDESKLKKYEGEHWVMSYENKPTITVVKETM